jgi:hypothetical protein
MIKTKETLAIKIAAVSSCDCVSLASDNGFSQMIASTVIGISDHFAGLETVSVLRVPSEAPRENTAQSLRICTTIEENE